MNEVLMRGEYIATTKKELLMYVKESFKNKNSKKCIHIGCLSNDMIDNIKNNVKGIKKSEIDLLFKKDGVYDVAIKQDAIRHIKKDSMSEKDVIDYILRIDDIIVNFDEVTRTKYIKSYQTNEVLLFRKQFDDGNYYAVELIYNKKRLLNTCTAYMYQKDFENKKRS